MNGVNLNQFQFDYDLTWMSFFQDGDGRTYARYGGRDDAGAETYLTKASLLRTMRQVLDLHADNAVQMAGRYEPVPSDATTPSDVPTMRSMIAKRKESCIHCHDVKVARLQHKRELGQLDKTMVFTYPSPGNLGIHVDPDRQDIVARVDADSPAAVAGLAAGDQLRSSDGHRILTFADFTRALEFMPGRGSFSLDVTRSGASKELTLNLPFGWRSGQLEKDYDPSWRPSLGTVGPGGGFWGIPLPKGKGPDGKRQRNGLADVDMAIRVNFIWADHAKQTGLKNNDIVVRVDNQSHQMTMRQFHAYLQLNHNWGDAIELVILRNGKKQSLVMQLPSQAIE